MAKPFVKWAGGKAKLASRVVAEAPTSFGRYHEPFLGAGAVFFALEEARPGLRSCLSDANRELIAAFRVVRDDVGPLTAALAEISVHYLALPEERRRRYYLDARARPLLDPVAAAARFIFLNKTGYNGLYRVNASGGFNVPHGRYANPRILDRDALVAASKALAHAELQVLDFAAACGRAEPGDFVYLDPPYQPLSSTAHFTAYTSGDFGPTDQERLRDTYDDLTRRGVFALLSNSEHPAIHELYAGRGYDTHVVQMSRAINSKASGRAPISELLISNASAL
jgi:DNA adenine methylase